jgi:methionyl-tRNA formyltransferase
MARRGSGLKEIWFFGAGKTATQAFRWLRQAEPGTRLHVCSPAADHLGIAARESGVRWSDADVSHWWNEFVGSPGIVISFLMPRHIPVSLLAHSRSGGLNFHPAPLPRYRGINCATFALLAREPTFGVTCHYMTERFDDGPLMAVRPLAVLDEDTAFSLEARSKKALLQLFIDVVTDRLWQTHPPDVCERPSPGTLYTKRMFDGLARVAGLGTPDLDRRVRAFWNPPRSAAYVERGGKKYLLAPGDQLATWGATCGQGT